MAKLIGAMVFTLILLAAVLTSCSAPTIGFRIPTAAVAGQSPAEVEADTAACEKAAPPGGDERQRTYQACMISRNYWTYVPVHLGWLVLPTGLLFPLIIGPYPTDIPLEIRQTRPHDPAMVADDLEDCKKAARAAGGWGSWGLEAALNSCLEQRGYAVRRWEPPTR